jgi:hypothetical protein
MQHIMNKVRFKKGARKVFKNTVLRICDFYYYGFEITVFYIPVSSNSVCSHHHTIYTLHEEKRSELTLYSGNSENIRPYNMLYNS